MVYGYIKKTNVGNGMRCRVFCSLMRMVLLDHLALSKDLEHILHCWIVIAQACLFSSLFLYRAGGVAARSWIFKLTFFFSIWAAISSIRTRLSRFSTSSS